MRQYSWIWSQETSLSFLATDVEIVVIQVVEIAVSDDDMPHRNALVLHLILGSGVLTNPQFSVDACVL